jgi:hypothetical protein
MGSESTYLDIIEGKIAEWKENINLLKEGAEKASADDKEQSTLKINKLSSAIETATLQLHDLDKLEDSSNTLMVKDKILKIFDSIDRDLIVSEGKTPFML